MVVCAQVKVTSHTTGRTGMVLCTLGKIDFTHYWKEGHGILCPSETHNIYWATVIWHTLSCFSAGTQNKWVHIIPNLVWVCKCQIYSNSNYSSTEQHDFSGRP